MSNNTSRPEELPDTKSGIGPNVTKHIEAIAEEARKEAAAGMSDSSTFAETRPEERPETKSGRIGLNVMRHIEEVIAEEARKEAVAKGEEARKEEEAANEAAQGKKRARDNANAGAETQTRYDVTGAPTAEAETPPVLNFSKEWAAENTAQRIKDGHHPGFSNSPEAGFLGDPETREKLGIFWCKQGCLEKKGLKGSLATIWHTATGTIIPVEVTVEKMKKSDGLFEGTVLIIFQENMSAEEVKEFRKLVGERDVNDYGALDGKKDKLDKILKEAHSVREARNPAISQYVFTVRDKDGVLLGVFDKLFDNVTGSLLRGIGGYMMISGKYLNTTYILSGGEEGVSWLDGRIKITAFERSNASDLRKVGYGSEDNGRPEDLARLVKDYEDSRNWVTYYVRDQRGNVETFPSLRQLEKKLNGGKQCHPLRDKINKVGLGGTTPGIRPKWVDSAKAQTAVVEWTFSSNERFEGTSGSYNPNASFTKRHLQNGAGYIRLMSAWSFIGACVYTTPALLQSYLDEAGTIAGEGVKKVRRRFDPFNDRYQTLVSMAARILVFPAFVLALLAMGHLLGGDGSARHPGVGHISQPRHAPRDQITRAKLGILPGYNGPYLHWLLKAQNPHHSESNDALLYMAAVSQSQWGVDRVNLDLAHSKVVDFLGGDMCYPPEARTVKAIRRHVNFLLDTDDDGSTVDSIVTPNALTGRELISHAPEVKVSLIGAALGQSGATCKQEKSEDEVCREEQSPSFVDVFYTGLSHRMMTPSIMSPLLHLMAFLVSIFWLCFYSAKMIKFWLALRLRPRK